MQLVRYNPYRNVNRRHNHLSDMFDGFFDDFFGPALPTRAFTEKPAHHSMKMDVYEEDDRYIVEAEMPGVAKEDVHLDVKDKTITIGGEYKREEEIKKENQIRMERSAGSFSRTFSLPFEVDTESVVAKLENGILKLEIPKPAEKQRKRIEIQ